VSSSFLANLRWLRDWCGVDLPVRGAVCRSLRSGQSATGAQNVKESFSLRILLGFEEIAHSSPCPFTRGHAAAWYFMCVAALRVEQSSDCIVNAFLPHSSPAHSSTIAIMATACDKHPDASKARPRPVWAPVAGISHPGSVLRELRVMLGATALARCILPDTDSPDGNPANASRWMLTPVPSHRILPGLIHLLTLPAIGMPPERAARYRGHSAKRFSLNACEASSSLTTADAHEIGRFSMSTAQCAELEPTAALLAHHELQSAVLPNLYAGHARVEKAFDRLTRFELLLRSATARAATSEKSLPLEGGWSDTFAGL